MYGNGNHKRPTPTVRRLHHHHTMATGTTSTPSIRGFIYFLFFIWGEGYTLVTGAPASIDVWIAATRFLSQACRVFECYPAHEIHMHLVSWFSFFALIWLLFIAFCPLQCLHCVFILWINGPSRNSPEIGRWSYLSCCRRWVYCNLL